VNIRAVLAICLGGLLLRLGFVVFSGAELTFPDEFRFVEEAYSLLGGTGLQFDGKYGHDMPLTAVLVAAVLYVSDGSLWAVKSLMVMLSTFTVYLIARISYVLSRDNVAALVAGSVSALYPFFIFYSALVLSETIFICFLVLYFLSVFNRNQNPKKQALFAGFAHLTRPTLIYFLPVVWVWQLLYKKLDVRQIIVVAVVFGIIVLPWVFRNYMIFESFVPSTTSSGHILWEGNNPWNTTGGVSGTFHDKSSWLTVVPEGLSELEEDEWKKSQAIAFIKQNPHVFVENGVKKALRLWSLWPNASEFQTPFYKAISIFSFGSVLALSVLGCILLTWLRREVMLIVLFAGYVTVLQILTLGSIRYRLPLEPLLIVIASIYFSTVWRQGISYFLGVSATRPKTQIQPPTRARK